MILVDFIAIGLVIIVGFAGAIAGFGRTLKAVTDGFFGVIISVIITYFLLGLVLKLSFVQNLVEKLVLALKGSSAPICSILLTIRIDVIVVAVALFVIVQLLRKLVVLLLKRVFEAKNPVSSAVNKIFGILLAEVVMFVILLVAFQIVFWITKEGAFYNFIKGSFFGLDKLYLSNPIASFIAKLNL